MHYSIVYFLSIDISHINFALIIQKFWSKWRYFWNTPRMSSKGVRFQFRGSRFVLRRDPLGDLSLYGASLFKLYNIKRESVLKEKFFLSNTSASFSAKGFKSWKLCEVKQRTERLVFGWMSDRCSWDRITLGMFHFSVMAVTYRDYFFCTVSARWSITLMIVFFEI